MTAGTEGVGGRGVSPDLEQRGAAVRGGALGDTALGQALAAQDERLSHCVHCGFCLPACPTYTRLGDEADSPRGRLHLMRAVAEGRLDPASDAYQRHLDRCLGCRACEPVCPSGVEYGLLLERARDVAVRARPPSRLQRLLLAAVEREWVLGPWMLASRLLRWTRLPALASRVLPSAGAPGQLRLGAAMLAASAPSPAPASGPGGAGGAADPATPRHPAGAAADGTDPASGGATARRRVGLLTGCIQQGLFARVNAATRRVLAANGWEVVEVPRQGCCGALHAHGGELGRARDMARRNVTAFREADPELVVANAAGCGAAMREYVHLLEEEDPATQEVAAWFSGRVRDVSEVLTAEGREVRPGAPLPLRVAYDAPCHLLHGQGVDEAPLRLLRAVPELDVQPLPGTRECCGGAGTYGITHPELGGRIGRDKVEDVRRSGAAVVATGNPGCIMQIGAGVRMAGLEVQVVHPVEILDWSYRKAGLYAG